MTIDVAFNPLSALTRATMAEMCDLTGVEAPSLRAVHAAAALLAQTSARPS